MGRYEQAIERLKQWDREHPNGYVVSDRDEFVFPELKESEGERIRKEIEFFIAANHKDDKEKAHWLYWLKKQGEQKPIDKIQLGKKYKCIASPRYSTFMLGKIYKPEDKFLCSLMNFCSDCFEPIEDGQNPWSEEDKKLIDDTCHLINTLASGYGEKVTEPITFSGTQMIASIKDRLRALVDNRPRSQWKPSEEHMEALYEETLKSDRIKDVRLISLYNDLKKLREE